MQTKLLTWLLYAPFQYGGRPRQPSCPGHPYWLFYLLLLLPWQTHLSGTITEQNNYTTLFIGSSILDYLIYSGFEINCTRFFIFCLVSPVPPCCWQEHPADCWPSGQKQRQSGFQRLSGLLQWHLLQLCCAEGHTWLREVIFTVYCILQNESSKKSLVTLLPCELCCSVMLNAGICEF